jgi:hypothetical protein
MIAFQVTLGMALLLRYRPRMTLSIAGLFWLSLTVLTAYAWATGATDDCGCYGSWLKSTPKQATLENLVFLAATLIAGWLRAALPLSRAGKKTWAVAAAPVFGLILPLLFGFSPSLTPRAGFEGNALVAGEVQGLESIDLARGSYLVVLLGSGAAVQPLMTATGRLDAGNWRRHSTGWKMVSNEMIEFWGSMVELMTYVLSGELPEKTPGKSSLSGRLKQLLLFDVDPHSAQG